MNKEYLALPFICLKKKKKKKKEKPQKPSFSRLQLTFQFVQSIQQSAKH
jgi:hypothetical protein